MSSWKDPEIAAVRAQLAAHLAEPGTPPPTLEQQRAGADVMGDFSPLPPGCRHEPVTAGGVKGERVIPVGAAPGRQMLYLHGGGYVLGSPRSHRPLVGMLAAGARATALVPDYRLGPENRFPAAVDDALAVYRWMLDQGGEPERIIVAGDSAGGGLTLALALALKEQGLPQPAGLFVISPWADLTQSSDTHRTKAEYDPMVSRAGLNNMAASYLGDLDARDPLASPVFGDFAGVAPMLIQVGSEEALLGDSLMVADRAGQARVMVRLEIWPEMIHVWHLFAGQLSAGRRAIDAATAWMDDRLGG